MKRLGPELKKPDLKNLRMPAVLGDLYQDLRDRRLLPLVVVALVALVAIPVLLSGSTSSPMAPPRVPAAVAEAGASGARLTVVKATPGLREPDKRLSHLRAKDPFEQHYTNAPVQQAVPVGAETATVTSETSTEVSVEAEEPSPVATAGPGESGGSAPGSSDQSNSGAGAPSHDLVFYTFAVDVQVSRAETKADGSKETSEPQLRKRVLPSTSLPGDKAQVVTYMGISPKTQKSLFLVSTDVTAVFGDAKCVAGSDSCQLLELETGIPQTFVYGADDVRYKINVLKVEPVAVGHR